VGRQHAVDQLGELLDRRRSGALRQSQRHIDGAIDGEPGGSLIPVDVEPLHVVDDLDRGSDDEVGRPVQATPQDDGRAGLGGLPGGDADGCGLVQLGPGVVAESLGQRRNQPLARGIVALRRGYGGDHRRPRPVVGRGDGKDDANCADRHHQRGDQRCPRRAFGVGHYSPLLDLGVLELTVVGVGSGAQDQTLGELGEFGVIERLTRGRPASSEVVIGPGDDGAVIGAGDGRVVVSTDMLVEGRHFRLDWSTPHDVGRKAMAQNAADIEAMGARVTAFVVGFGAPADTPAAHVDALADGMWQEAGRIGAVIVGGDVVSSPQWVVSVTVLGDLGGRAPVLRSGARPGSQLAVTGQLGYSAAGYALWDSGIEGFKEFRQRHLVPQPPYRQGRVAAAAGAEAMIDISDGLVGDLRHVAEASGVAVDLSTVALTPEREALMAAAEAVGADPWDWVFGGGEDHALVAAFAGPVPAGWRLIGRVLEGPSGVLVDGEPWRGYAGWQSFGAR